MPNPLKGEAQLTLEDGRELMLALDFDGLIEAEQAYGKPLVQLLAEAQAGFMGALRALLWGALRRHHPDLRLADVTALLMDQQARAIAAITAAIDAAMPARQPSGEGDNPGNRRARRAGKRSGSNGAKPG